MSSIYLIRLISNRKVCWEQVTEFVFENRKQALNDEGTGQRYYENDYVIKNDLNQLNISYNGPYDGLSQIIKFFQIKEYEANIEGFVNIPSHINFSGSGKNKTGFLLNLKSGTKYKIIAN